MARFDVYVNPDHSERHHTPFVLDLQNGFLAMLETFVAVPLRVPGTLPLPISRLHPVLQVEGQAVVMDTPMMATLPKRGFTRPVANVRQAQFDIQDALDTLFGDH